MNELKINQIRFQLFLQDNLNKLKNLKNLSILELPNNIDEISKNLDIAFSIFAETFIQEEATIELTNEFINSCKNERGANTGFQWRVLQKAFNLPSDFNKKKGWLKDLMGRKLTQKQADDFMEARNQISEWAKKSRIKKDKLCL
jgi:hypothetical protein